MEGIDRADLINPGGLNVFKRSQTKIMPFLCFFGRDYRAKHVKCGE